ncbi:MAG: tetratricopeptide repeat protein, partial [Deltaproteobacteria bacterium]|nr:tetratricopeptide repeat protein [Deltaproteobacteria bacterium]
PKGLAANIWRYEVVELAPPDWQGYKPFYIFIGIIFISFIFNLRQSIIYIVLILPFIAISTRAIRFITLIGIVGAPIVVRNISNLKFQISNFKLLLLKIFVSISIVILTIATLANIGPFKNYENTFGISINASSLPEGALEYLDKNNIQGRIFNTFHFGGYITFKEHPKRRTFIDGRGGAAMPDYLNAFNSQKNWSEVEKKYDVNIAILEYPHVPSVIVDMDKDFGFPVKGWTLVYWDAASMVYLKNDTFKDIVERDGYRYVKPANGPMQFGQRLYNKQYLAGVINELERNIRINPNPRAYLLLGFVYNETNEFDKAIEVLNKVFEYRDMPHRFAFAHNGLGFSYLKKGRFDTALYHFRKSLSYAADADVLHNLGIAYLQMNDYKNAVYYFKKAISTKDNMLPAYISLINTYKKLGLEKELAEIEAAYRQKLNASQSEGHFNIALRLYISGKLDEALEEFKKSIEINPYSPASHTNLGFIYYDKENKEMAKREFTIAIEIDKDWADAHYGLALVYKKLGDKSNAKNEFEEYLRINPRGLWARKAREEISLLE